MLNANIMTVLAINCCEERKKLLFKKTLYTQSGEALALNIRETFLSLLFLKKIFRDNFQSLSTKILNMLQQSSALTDRSKKLLRIR